MVGPNRNYLERYPTVALEKCDECKQKTELAMNAFVQHCKFCGAEFNDHCTEHPYRGPPTDRWTYECCGCHMLTEESQLRGHGTAYCRFCGHSLCEYYCDIFEVKVVDGVERYRYIRGSAKCPPDYGGPCRLIPRSREDFGGPRSTDNRFS
jgi:hypothetical protein